MSHPADDPGPAPASGPAPGPAAGPAPGPAAGPAPDELALPPGRRRPLLNPLWVKGWRSRCRTRHLVSWGVVTLTVATFVALITYTTITERDLAPEVDAAKAVIPGIVVVQAVLLMMFGTGAVAAGISRERDQGLLDYERMTPMSPTARILGHLVGLPLREWVLVLMTMPLVLVAAWAGAFPLATLGHFYLVFVTSVLVYHMTALVAGMVAAKPRLAQMISIGLVAVLYFVLPNLSRIGITFFEFLTIRPTFFGLLQQELPESLAPRLEASGIDAFRPVPLFDGTVHPTAYTLLVQGFVLVTMFAIVHRRWRDAASHVLSKAGAVAVYAGVGAFFLGSVWAIIRQDEAYRQVFGRFSQLAAAGIRSPESLELLLVVATGFLSLAYLLLVGAITPERHRTLEGWRRVRKRGGHRLGWNEDAASSLPAAAVMLTITVAAGATVVGLAVEGGQYVASWPAPTAVAILLAGLVGTGLFVQAVRSMLGLRLFVVGLFLLWMVPFFAMMILLAAFDEPVLATYVGLPCPPVTLGWSIAHMLETTVDLPGRDPDYMPAELAREGWAITAVGSLSYLAAGVVLQLVALRRRRRLRELGTGMEAEAGAGTGTGAGAAEAVGVVDPVAAS